MSDSPEEKIHIALTFDRNFWAPAYATMRSICLHTKRRQNLVFHLCHRPLATGQIDDLRAIETEFGAQTCFHDITASKEFKETVSPLPFHPRLTNIVYARLLFDHILPDDVDRVIYLDCDMMVVAPIEDLWSIDLEGKAIGAVCDSWGAFISSGRDFRVHPDLCDPSDTYFNAGMLVIDMAAWRSERILEKIQSFTDAGIMDRIHYDQGFLNIIFRNNFRRIDWKWNVINPREAHEALGVFLLHYTGVSKPWNLVSNVAFARMYRHVMTNEIFYKFLGYRIRRRFARFIPFLRPK